MPPFSGQGILGYRSSILAKCVTYIEESPWGPTNSALDNGVPCSTVTLARTLPCMKEKLKTRLITDAKVLGYLSLFLQSQDGLLAPLIR